MSKIGEGHAAAMGRLGLAELRNAMNPSRSRWPTRKSACMARRRKAKLLKRGGPGQGMEQESTLDDLKSYAAEKAKEAEQKMAKAGPDQDRGLEM